MKLALLLIVLVLPVFSVHALAQAPAAAPSKAYTGTVTADNVYIRCGPSASSAYPFGKLALGDILEVIDEGFGWATVRTNGPAFRNIYGYVLANDKVVLSPDGQTLTVNAETDARMLAENGDLNTPEAKEAAIEAALHNEARARFVAVELRFLEKATQPVRDALLKLKGNLELLGASISHGKNIPVEAKDAMMKLKNSLNDRVRKLVEKDLFGWLPGEVKPREVPGGKP